MSRMYPRSIRMSDMLWNKLQELAEVGDTSRNKLAVKMLQSYVDTLTNGLDLKNPKDRATIRVMLERFL